MDKRTWLFTSTLVVAAYSFGATCYCVFLLAFISRLSSRDDPCDGLASRLESKSSSIDRAKCDRGWIYLESTDFCYYYRNDTRLHKYGQTTYTLRRAEDNCQKMGGHLVSIHSFEEENFLRDLTKSYLYRFASPFMSIGVSGCGYYRGVWIGLVLTEEMDGKYNVRRWTDGTPDDYYPPTEVPIRGPLGERTNFIACNDRPSNGTLKWTTTDYVQTRYVCKKKSSQLS